MQIIISMWPTQKQPQHAYVLGNRNYSYWSALFRSLCSCWVSLRAVSLDTVEFCGFWAERQHHSCLDEMDSVLRMQPSSFWSSLQYSVYINWHQPLITETTVFPQAWTNPPCPFSVMPTSLLSLTKFPYRTVINAAVPINYSNWMWFPTHTPQQTCTHVHLCTEVNALHKELQWIYSISYWSVKLAF